MNAAFTGILGFMGGVWAANADKIGTVGWESNRLLLTVGMVVGGWIMAASCEGQLPWQKTRD